MQFDKVIYSPLKHTLHTAQIITNQPITTDEKIIERFNGEMEGKLKDDLPFLVDFNDSNETRYNIENITHFRERIKSFYDDLVKLQNQNILVVTHSGIILYLRSYFEGEPQDGDYKKYAVKNCEVITYEN